MIEYILACTLWAAPDVVNVQVPVNEYAMATMQETIGNFEFDADVVEDRMNSVTIIYKPTETKAMAYSAADYTQRALTVKLDTAQKQSSLDCEIKPK
ncbi:MAG: hypothetical protein H7061_13330 [Bdellovibrionaceae bacterium]|nr:hypothetical protein [Bdellovibrio sp.]